MRERRYAMTVTLLVGLLFVGSLLLNVTYTQHVQQQAERQQDEQRIEADHRWCALFEALDRPVPSNIQDPAQRARSQQAVRLFHQLRVDLGCVER